MRFFRKTSAILVMILFLSLSISPALAAGPSSPTGPRGPVGPQGQVGPTGPTGPTDPVGPNGSSGQTQPNPESTSVISANENNAIDTSTDASISNSTDVNIVTGANNISGNTDVANFSSGNANGDITLVDTANSVFSDESTVSTTSMNAGTGNILFGTSSSSNKLNGGTDYLISGDSVAQIDNSSNVSNPIDIDANTGDNLFSENTKVGNIVTGDINLGVNLINLLNLYNPNLILSLDILSLFGDLTGDIILPETTSTPANVNDPMIHATDLSIRQDANVDNIIGISTNTGENNVGNMTATGNLQTGGSQVIGNVSNILNALALPYFYILNVFGDWNGSTLGLDPSLLLINNMAGPNSQNINSLDQDSSSSTSINNDANVDNRLSIAANTGRNTIKDSTVTGNIKTGSINIATNIVNILNSLSKGAGKFRIGIINVFGNWKGNLKSKDYNAGNVIDEGKTPIEDPITRPISQPQEDMPIFMTEGQNIPASNSHKSAYKINTSGNNQVMGSVSTDSILAKADSSDNSSPWTRRIMAILALAAAWLAVEMILKYKSVQSEN